MAAPSPFASSENFGFLATYDNQLVTLGALAERYFPDDPITCLMKLRQFGEVLGLQVAARFGLLAPDQTITDARQVDLLRRLRIEANIPREIIDLFHGIRKAGNDANHANRGSHAAALSCLKFARELGVWFHRTWGNSQFKPGPFQPPRPPPDPTAAMAQEMEALRAAHDAALTEAQKAEQRALAAAEAHSSAEETIRLEREERRVWEELAVQGEVVQIALRAELQALQEAALAAPPAQFIAKQVAAQQAAASIDIDEFDTRVLIDQQLRQQGWDVDSQTLRHAAGTRPIKNRAMAIAEWPTSNGPADYALFIGTLCVGMVEAKRKRKNVQAAIDQAGRYSQGFLPDAGMELPSGGPWAAHSTTTQEPAFRVPFLFAANGRGYLKQIETHSGIWFRDTRNPTNLRRALTDWPTPEGLTALLGMDKVKAQADLTTLPFDFGFPLRPYQQEAIRTVEATLADDSRRTMLLAMATGTGKTKLAIAMLYRLLHTKRFRRICFVVDRNALGEQAAAEFKTTRIVTARTFSDIFGLKELSDTTPDPETKVHICSIQGLVKRVFSARPEDRPPVDQYDLIVVDECHRGYLLDREMSDAELSFRSEAEYISVYRRVLEHFDAVKIGLTATPALHTTQIFGEPIYRYSYREAVIDGYLIDHEPALQITTELSRDGIHFRRGEELSILDPATGQIDLAFAPDELDFEVKDFNRRVLTQEFNRVVAETLAEHIDPSLPGKTLIFATTDAHADMVVGALKTAFTDRYGAIDDGAVVKITGSIDKPTAMIRRYRNDPLPKVAVTVDLLTTGVDIPSITSLVFIRRVNSRILYDQMLGRATRRCDEIGKETFRIFDAVGIYDALQNLTEMKPVVVNPTLTLTQLIEELARVEDPDHRALIRDQILVRLRRRIGKLNGEAQEAFTRAAGEAPSDTLARIETAEIGELAEWIKARPGLGPILDWNPDGGRPVPVVISVHGDKLVDVTAGYGSAGKPEDYLESFGAYVKSNLNRIAGLQIVTQRPRDLTRADLRDLAVALDQEGFSETALRRAWRDTRNEDIAATIIGFIRQAALGDALMPWRQRVEQAMARILKSRSWTDPQRRWLERIGREVADVGVADPAVLDEGQFKADAGGFKRLDRVFNGGLAAILGDINEELWRKTG